VWLRELIGCAAVLGLCGCYQEMSDGPRHDPLEPSAWFDDGMSARHPPAGTIPRGTLDLDTHLHRGTRDGRYLRGYPFPITRADLERGRERFSIYCSPCHGETGSGDGIIALRGFEEVETYHRPGLRRAPEGYLFEVVTRGRGAMPSYAERIEVRDRWRVVAYLRALQLSQHATLADAPATERARLTGEGAP
jgi:hypothetical protein